MEDQTSAKAGLLLRLSSLGVRTSDIAMVREALFANTELSKPKRHSNLEGSALKQQQSVQARSPNSQPQGSGVASEELRQHFRREFSRSSLEFDEAAAREEAHSVDGAANRDHDEEFKTELPEEMIAKLDSWLEFDIFEFALKAEKEGGVLVRMGELLFDRHGFRGRYRISPSVLTSFLTALQAGYKHELPYHNAIHAADVGQSMSHFIVQCGLAQRGDDLTRFAAIVSALAHDVGHPGYTNRYMVETRSELAMIYNDKSPLENMHASKLFSTMWAYPDGRQDITANLEHPRDVTRFRKLCIEMILATDNAHHEKTVEKLSRDTDDESIFRAALHAADLGGGGKTMQLAHNWAGRVLQEFFTQGDAERVLGLYPVLPGMDRNNPMPKSVYQGAFIRQICLPLYSALNSVPGLDFSVQVRCLEYNARLWVGDTSETHPSRLKETRSFSLQKQPSQAREFSSVRKTKGGNKEGAERSTAAEEAADDSNGRLAVNQFKSLREFSPRAESDVSNRLNLSPRAFLVEGDGDHGAPPRRSAIREAVRRSRASKGPSSLASSVAPSPTQSPAFPPQYKNSPTPTRKAEVGTGSPSSAFRSTRKQALRQEDESTPASEEHRKRKDASKQSRNTEKRQPLS